MGDIELAVKRTKELEGLLKDIGAEGRGLHEMVSSVESDLPHSLVKRLRFVATVRNKVVHNPEYERIDDRAGFIEACQKAERALRQRAGAAQEGVSSTIIGWVVLAMILLLLLSQC